MPPRILFPLPLSISRLLSGPLPGSLLFLLALLGLPLPALATAVQTPLFTPGAGTYTMPLPTTVVSLPSPNATGVVTACYTANTSCTPALTGTTISCPASGSCSVYVDPATTVEICALGNQTGYTQSSLSCALFTRAGGGTATGDGRGVQSEPKFPTGCTVFHATKTTSLSTADNVDPFNATSTSGSTSFGACSGAGYGSLGCFGGTSWEPSSETLDTAFQTALNGTLANNCLELEAAGTSNAIVLGKWTIPSNKTVVVDGGVTIFASRDPRDYSGSGTSTSCGGAAVGGSSCGSNAWIQAQSSSGSNFALMGYGTLDARAWDKFTITSGCNGAAFCGFNYNRVQTYCNVRGGPTDGSPKCVVQSGTPGKAYGPNMMNMVGGLSNITFYKITFKDCGNFCIEWGKGSAGATFWGIKIMAPFEVSNTDGWDPSYAATNGSLVNSFISNGDNHIAFKSNNSDTSGATQAISVLNLQTGAGIGVSVGYESSAGVSNLLINGLVQNGNQNNAGQQVGHGIWDLSGQAGAVSNVTFENVCMMNESTSLYYYMSGAGSMTNIQELNETILSGVATTIGPGTGNSGKMEISSYSGSSPAATFALNNVVAKGGVTSDYKYATVDGENVSFSSSISGTGVTNNITNPGGNTPFPCTATTKTTLGTWQPLIGELWMAAGGNNNAQNFSGAAPASYTIQATLRPATDVSTKESPNPTSSLITIYDSVNGAAPVSVGTITLSGTGAYGSLALSGVTGGSHVYTAKYAGDANYPAYTFGSLGAEVTGSTPSTGKLNWLGKAVWKGKMIFQ